MIVDISPTGAKLALEGPHDIPAIFDLVIPIDKDLEETRPCELRWRDGAFMGARFT